jgi:hypothetical protein
VNKPSQTAPESFTFHHNKGWVIVGFIGIILFLFIMIGLIQPEILLSVIQSPVWYAVTALVQTLALVFFLIIFREKIVMTRDTITLVKLWSTTTQSWHRIIKMKIKFVIPLPQLLTHIFGKRGLMLIIVEEGERTFRYILFYPSTGELEQFLDRLAYFSKRTPQITQPHKKTPFFESQEWSWDRYGRQGY